MEQPVKVCVVTSTRADYSKLRGLMLALEKSPLFELVPLVIGSHLLIESGYSFRLVEKDFAKSATKVSTVAAGNDTNNMADSVALTILKVSQFLALAKPKIVIVHGDRFDAFGVASASTLLQIFTVHLEGGELSGTIDGKLRHSISKLSDLHFTCTEAARMRVIEMGEENSAVFCTGCPSYDVFLEMEHIGSGHSTEDLLVTHRVVPHEYFIIMYHPDTCSIQDTVKQYRSILEAVDRTGERAILFYPNIDPGSKDMIQTLHEIQKTSPTFSKNVNCMTSLPHEEFIILLKNCKAIVGNSSAIIREAAFFGTPAVNVGTRQQGRTCPPNVFSVKGENSDEVLQALLEHPKERFDRDTTYGDGHAVSRMMKHLEGVLGQL
uniref:UDP-N-acetylglucosamine 2-epimerase domain-containing protein n=1 Tax=Chromera velia CCMP2878 TaxID=1169474 RepID=A0A0G4FHF4_9ALVE|mmetsp:Transcript_8577/g.16864  ORF Transcript_8577/g.16864 Transcript_8577/m.16864 type:complete len:379 (-) Transcript_8577:153-1289(-)|eukprot:Cvel_3342.t1-p1 / transcript=Cvel_3342.t1 / gene=Cvel_3342 / organism=Chromera_velia_CCMP2878 / gene_product=Bifunctional UDP-N-acetylglucosamine, putative / transcript_product=Bifunctional UDP-N-acetylglucosamine, putative / location=Cvel_scaffold133:47773-48906(-) / protein_length=378 / sequence_SO=supercontig / SO=protein_coding / is_pseudo=false